MAHPAQRAFLRGDRFLLAFYAGLFIVFALAQFGEDSSLLAELFKAPNRALDGFVFSYSNSRHKLASPPITADKLLPAAKFKLFLSQVKQITFKINGLAAWD